METNDLNFKWYLLLPPMGCPVLFCHCLPLELLQGQFQFLFHPLLLLLLLPSALVSHLKLLSSLFSLLHPLRHADIEPVWVRAPGSTIASSASQPAHGAGGRIGHYDPAAIFRLGAWGALLHTFPALRLCRHHISQQPLQTPHPGHDMPSITYSLHEAPVLVSYHSNPSNSSPLLHAQSSTSSLV